MRKYRKLIASLVGVLIISLEASGVVFPADSIDLIAPITTVIVSILVWAVPNDSA